MSTPLTIAEVERIAALAQLELSDDEKRTFAQQLADVLAYVEQLQDVDTTGVAATAHVDDAPRAERDDVCTPGLSTDEAVANAPDADRQAGLFRVPRVIGG